MITYDLRSGGEGSDPTFPLWVRRSEHAADDDITVDGEHGDEAIFVLAGAIRFEGREVGAGGAAIVESSAAAEFHIGRAGATVVHFGPTDPKPPSGGLYGPPADGPHGVHLIGPRGLLAIEEPGRATRFFADSTCDTCRITLFSTARDQFYHSSSHSHSQDEIIYLLDGEVQLGGTRLLPDMGAMIPGDVPYGFRSGSNGFKFLNYRRDVSVYRSSRLKRESIERPRDSPDIAVINDVR